MIKKTLSVMGLAVASSAFAGGVAVTLDNTFASRYFFRGLEVDNGTFVMPSVEASYGNATVGVWTAFQLHDSDAAGSGYNEVDLYGSYDFAITEEITLTVGGTAYLYPERAGRNTVEAFVGASTTFVGVEVNPVLYYDFTNEGWIGELNLGYVLPLADFGTELRFSGSLGYSHLSDTTAAPGDVKAKWGYYSIGVEIPYALSENAELFAGTSFTDAFSRKVAGVSTRAPSGLVLTAGIRASF
jgi:uncharacterized protein (TIGR02001 family)